MSYLPSRQTLFAATLAAFSLFSQSSAHLLAQDAAPPLHQQIDDLVNRSQYGPVAEMSPDTTFLRRVYLDLIGRIPSVTESKAFLAETAPDKRVRLIDDLMSRPDFDRHLAVMFDNMLMERRGNSHVKSDEFRKYLETSFREGKSYQQLVGEILAADGTDEKNRAASAFYLERDVAPDLLTREIGRVFFGVDLQCAQCHNHPNIDDYHQEDYYGLQAFVVRASLFQPDKKKPAVIAEKAEGEAAFKSVFTDRASMTGPRPLLGDEVVEVVLKPGERYEVAPAKDVRHVPSYSRLAKLSEVVTADPTFAFDRNIANRLWAQMLGRGLVHPVDLHHSGNPPSNPELLQMISEQFAAMNYDVKAFLRQIALSETYQRSAQLGTPAVPVEDLKAQVAGLKAEAEKQIDLSYEVDAQVDKATEVLDAAMDKLKPLREAIEAANKVVTEKMKARDTAQAKVDARQKEIAGKQANQKLVAAASSTSKAAAEALKDDKELAAATATIQKKLEAFNAEIAKLQETEKGEANALSQATEQLKASEAQADAAIAAATPAEDEVRKLRSEQIRLRSVAAQHRRNSKLAEQKADQLTTLVELEEMKIKATQLAAEIPQVQQQLAQASTELPTYQQQLKDQQAAMTAAATAVTAAQGLVQKTDGELKAQQETHGLLSESLAKLTAAVERVESKEGLTTAQSEITKSVEVVSLSIQNLESQHASQLADQLAKEKVLATADQAVKQAQATLASHTAKIGQLDGRLKQSQQDLRETQLAQESLWQTVAEDSASRLNASEISQLTPEQLGWSVLTATGQSERQRASEESKLNKEKPLSEEDKKDPAKVAAREREIDQATYDTLSKTVVRFVQLFGAAAGLPQNEFFATADQALFFANGGELRSWLSPAGGNLADRLNRMESPDEIAQELYLSVLCRNPTEAELQDVKNYLGQRTDAKTAAVQELAWALISSTEFRFQF